MPVTLDFLTPTIDALVRATLDFTCAAHVANAAVSRVREALGRRGLTAIDDARTPEYARYLAALPAELRELETSCPRRRAVAELADALPALWAALDALDDALIAAAPLLDDPRAPLAARRTNQIRGVALRAAAPYALARALPDPVGFFAVRAIVGDAPLDRSAAALAELDAVRFELLAARESPAAHADAVAVPQEAAAGWNALSDRQRDCLRVLAEAKAIDADSRLRGDDIARRAEGRAANANGFKAPLADLAMLGLIESKTGRDGGYWLTIEGQNATAKTTPSTGAACA